MTTKLDGELKRELLIGGEPYTLTISTGGFSLVVKGRRKGLELTWSELVSGDAALAIALKASLTANLAPSPGPVAETAPKRKSRQDRAAPAKPRATRVKRA